MSKKASNRNFPADLAALFKFDLILPVIAIGASCLLSLFHFLKTEDAIILFVVALGIGFWGIFLLLFARLPLYRQHRFWTFGPRELPSFNRKLHWLAYLFVVTSVLLFLIVWLRVK
jgi:predicted membrane channel-forming protein YqfA (hemolysin III family)